VDLFCIDHNRIKYMATVLERYLAGTLDDANEVRYAARCCYDALEQLIEHPRTFPTTQLETEDFPYQGLCISAAGHNNSEDSDLYFALNTFRRVLCTLKSAPDCPQREMREAQLVLDRLAKQLPGVQTPALV
jgi:hypothetical protein